MKKIVFFNTPFSFDKVDRLEMEGYFPRLGLASVASFLLSLGYEVKIVDPIIDVPEEILKKIKKFKPDFIGISSYTNEIFNAAETAYLAKKAVPGVKVVLGGAHASALPQRTLEEFPVFDYLVIGEGEMTTKELVEGKPLSKIKGLAFFDETGKFVLNQPRPLIENLDSLPFPAWELYDIDQYRGGSLSGVFGKKGKDLELPVESARGCPFSCIFCFRVCGRTIRFRSVKSVVDEVQRDVEKFGANKIFFIEGTFGVNKKLGLELCREIIKRGLHKKITWSTGGRVDVVDKELLGAMKDSGCVYIGFGVESGDEKILKAVGKNTTISQIKRAFQLCREVGIPAEANFIIGHPFETEKTAQKTINLGREIKADYANYAILVPFPGTKVAEMAKKGVGGARILSYDWRLYGKQIGAAMDLRQLPREKLISLQKRAYRSFYFRPEMMKVVLQRVTNPSRLLFGIKSLLGF